MREIFGLPKSTVFLIVNIMTDVIYNISVKEIKFPKQNEFNILKNKFARYGIHNGLVMAIDGTHIPIRRPEREGMYYYNRKGFYNINLVCLVDPNMYFRGATYNYGSCHDSRVLWKAQFFDKIMELPENVFISADAAFQFCNKIKVPSENPQMFSNENTASKSQRVFTIHRKCIWFVQIKN